MKQYGLTSTEMHELFTYNAEVARGIVHTPEWDARMNKFQDILNASRRAHKRYL